MLLFVDTHVSHHIGLLIERVPSFYQPGGGYIIGCRLSNTCASNVDFFFCCTSYSPNFCPNNNTICTLSICGDASPLVSLINAACQALRLLLLLSAMTRRLRALLQFLT